VRYPAAKVKEAIFHPDIEIRDRATMYFAKAFSSDLTIMPLVIKAVETYGRQNDAYRLIGASRDLPQTEDTISWVIDELNGEADKHENYAYNLSMVLVDADLTLLLPRESDILDARHFLADLRTPLTDRLRMLAWDEATCWRNLEEFCEEGKDKRYTNEVNLSYANMVVEALARYSDECEPKVREWLAVKLDDYSHHPMKWLEPLVVRLAGQAQLESTIPLIVGKLLEDGGDLLNEECADALAHIGTPAVLHAIAEAFPTAEQHFRIYATNPLEHIHSDLAVEITLQLLEKENDQIIRRQLADSLLFQFAKEGIEIARQLLVDKELDFTGRGLRNSLLETCTLMGERFPEYDEWLATEKAEKVEHWRRVKELEGDPERLMLFALEKLTGKKAPEMPKAKAPVLPSPRPPLHRKAEVKQKVGRNDPCPCGSGKKFKTCCMRR
jgi:hypothetical protein